MRTKALDTLYIPAPKLNQFHLLRELGSDAHITQAELARRCGLSVAMVNNYMKELCDSGLVEFRRKSSKSISYHLTPHGEEVACSIQRELLHELVNLFAQTKEQIRDLVFQQAGGLLQRVVLFGSGHLAELALHALESADVSVIGVCDANPKAIGHDWCGREVVNASQIRYLAPDTVIIADSERAEQIYRSLANLADRGVRLICLDRRMPEGDPSGEAPAPLGEKFPADEAKPAASLATSGIGEPG